MAHLNEKFGLLQWFYLHEFDRVKKAVERMQELGLTRLRTGLSWAEFTADDGPAWYDFVLEELSRAGIKVLLSIAYTPAEISRNGSYTGLPSSLSLYADFVEEVIRRYAGKIDEIQLWNEPNCDHYFDLAADPGWKDFAVMIRDSAKRAKGLGVKTMLGGTIAGAGWAPLGQGWPPDAAFYSAMYADGAMENIDAISFHSFPGMWVSGDPNNPDHSEWSWGEPDQLWSGWENKLQAYGVLAQGREVVIGETGFSAFDWYRRGPGLLDEQCIWLQRAAKAPSRVYWYSLFDIAPGRSMIGGDGGTDPRNPYFGLITADDIEKPAYQVLKDLLKN